MEQQGIKPTRMKALAGQTIKAAVSWLEHFADASRTPSWRARFPQTISVQKRHQHDDNAPRSSIAWRAPLRQMVGDDVDPDMLVALQSV